LASKARPKFIIIILLCFEVDFYRFQRNVLERLLIALLV